MRYNNTPKGFLAKLSKTHKILLSAAIVIIVITLLFQQSDEQATETVSDTQQSEPAVNPANSDVTDQQVEGTESGASAQQKTDNNEVTEPKGPVTSEYVVVEGDTLGGIFEKMAISQKTLYELLDADLDVLALDDLELGESLYFTVDNDELERLELRPSLAKRVIFERRDHAGFEYKEIAVDGKWQQQRFIGKVLYSFGGSAQQAGLTMNESYFVANLLKEKIDFVRQIRPNDRFEILVDRQYIDGQATGASRVRAVRVYNHKHVIAAYLYKGSYYDEDGNSLKKAFQRLPLLKRYRISSSFNPYRRHPITGLRRPHNGTDFAVPPGTTVLSTGDGVVKRVVRHKYAGLYIEVDHGNSYSTRYLHLSKALVKRGQRVKRGEKIALSGNTGRTTGPHLHFELRRNGAAINAMTAHIPIAKTIEKKELKQFKQQIAEYQKALDKAEVAVVMPLAQLDDSLIEKQLLPIIRRI
ncbi:murein DD-endopeptidase [Sinobacterium caligoides]|uniref:Murein DD-endopeptidase n=1 Tax=Sinobacterium caligoides TaxID=933926 RepID=A0A3N2DMY1_9GAMM|nr:peptidoglycan DD-metalloendopeptidase family protein [Sinobacterium caligoides]ROS01130.1 murein DD-endopeptidase [Sinobacterium caligoides]